MSDHAQVLAFKIDGHAAMERAAEALAWLAERGIIEPLPSDCGLGALAHRPGPKVLDAVKSPPEKGGYFDFRKGRTNGMEVHASMRATLQMGGESMPSFRCPKCNTEIDADEVLPLVEDVGNPFKGAPEVKCGKCKKAWPLDALAVEGAAFANLTLRFWNWWPLTPKFVKELATVCGAPATVLHEHL